MPETEVETPAAPPANETVKEEAVKADETKRKRMRKRPVRRLRNPNPKRPRRKKSPRNLLHHLPPPSIKRISKKMLFMCINSIGLLRFPPSALPVSNSKLGLSS